VTLAIAAPVISEDNVSPACEARSGKDISNSNSNSNDLDLAESVLDGFFRQRQRQERQRFGGGRHFKQKDHAKAKQHAAKLNTAKTAPATHAATKLDVGAARTNDGNTKGVKGGDFGSSRRSLLREGFGSDFGGLVKGASGGFDDFGIGSGKGVNFGFNNFGGSEFGSGGGLFYRCSGALFSNSKGGGYDKELKKHKQVYKHLAAHKAKAEAEGEKKHELKKSHGKGGDFI
ncbi:hypothetical protein OC835_007873, partial [Tilletia horrida]